MKLPLLDQVLDRVSGTNQKATTPILVACYSNAGKHNARVGILWISDFAPPEGWALLEQTPPGNLWVGGRQTRKGT